MKKPVPTPEQASRKHRTPFVSLLLTAVIFQSTLHAQSDPEKYKERAAVIRQEVWGWKVPAFTNRTVPKEYANESSVILARRAEIEADTKMKVNWALSSHRNFYYNSTVRELVKINDKASLDEYSQMSYRQFKKLNSWVTATATTFLGVRIIKPDGSMKEVNLDEAVMTKTDKKDQQRKLAIGDLQVGDLLDYYVRVEEFSESIKEPERLIFVFGDDHPILDYSFHCQIGNKYAVEYRSMNKAPEAKQSTNEDKDLILDLAMKNLAAVPTNLWMSSQRELPAFRINVLAGGQDISGRGKGAVVKDVPLKDIINTINTVLSYPQGPGAYYYVTTLDKMLRAYDRKFPKTPDDSLARLICYTYRFIRYYNSVDKDLSVGEERNHMDINNYDYLNTLKLCLTSHHINCNFVVAPSRYGPDLKQVMGPGDLMLLLKVNVDKPFFVTNNNMFSYPGDMPAYVEGQPYLDIDPKVSKRNIQDVSRDATPLSNAGQNLHQEAISLSFEGADMQLLRAKRHTVLTGNMKIDEQKHLLNFEDCYESERQDLKVEKSIMDDLKKARRSKNVSEDYATALQKARTSLKDRFREEIVSEFDIEPKEVVSWKIDNMGIRNYAPDMAYSSEFTWDGMVQRAGNNYLLNIGKAFNSPLKLNPSQRNRTVDVYMPYARTLDCTVTFNIPQGYTVVGADKLNKKLENECGSVLSVAEVKGNQLVVHFRRMYNNNQEAASKWPQLLAIIDAATDFSGTKVLLKKG